MEKTFAQKVKSELCEPRVERKCCAVAEAYGVLLYCRSFSPREIRISTACGEFAGRLFFTPAALKIRQKPPLSNPGERFFKVFGAKS